MAYFIDREADEKLLYKRSSTSRMRARIEFDDDISSESDESSQSDTNTIEESTHPLEMKKLKKTKRDAASTNAATYTQTPTISKSRTVKRRNDSAGRSSCYESHLLEEMPKTNKIFSNLTNRVKSTERRIKAMENQLSQAADQLGKS